MPDIDLNAIKARADAATPGPWRVEWVDVDNWYMVYGQPNDGMVCPEVATLEDGGRDDAEFIAHARQDIDDLLAEVDRLNVLLADMTDEHHDDILTRYATLEDDHGIEPDSSEGRAYFTGYQDGLGQIERQKAEAWDEGYARGTRDAEADMEPADNPYRSQP